MKKPAMIALTLVMLLSLGGASASGKETEALKSRQAEVHAAAELLRELGIEEDDRAIQLLSDEWWRCHGELVAREAAYLGTYYITGYVGGCAHCCGNSRGITASGEPCRAGVTVAMYGIPFGTVVYIEGLGEFVVQDRGVGPGVVDVACESHAECYRITGTYRVWII